jgi:hypothetical protein
VTEEDLAPFKATFGNPQIAAELVAAADRVVTF